jgi:hypothetical protein
VAELKTKPTGRSVSAYLASIQDEDVRRDCRTLSKMMSQVTRSRPKMWGTSIVGFGRYRYARNGHTLEWFLTGFAPRKRDLTVYLMAGFQGYGDLLRKLGKHRKGVGCLYLRSLDDIHLRTLRRLIVQSTRRLAKTSV